MESKKGRKAAGKLPTGGAGNARKKKNAARGTAQGAAKRASKKSTEQPKITVQTLEEAVKGVKKADQARREENVTIGICPFFKQDRGGGRVSCEGANFHFPDKESRREYVYRLCADPQGYKSCPLQTALNGYYERKYAQNE